MEVLDSYNELCGDTQELPVQTPRWKRQRSRPRVDAAGVERVVDCVRGEVKAVMLKVRKEWVRQGRVLDRQRVWEGVRTFGEEYADCWC